MEEELCNRREILQNTMKDFEVEHNYSKVGYTIIRLSVHSMIRKEAKEELILLIFDDLTGRTK